MAVDYTAGGPGGDDVWVVLRGSAIIQEIKPRFNEVHVLPMVRMCCL